MSLHLLEYERSGAFSLSLSGHAYLADSIRTVTVNEKLSTGGCLTALQQWERGNEAKIRVPLLLLLL